MKTAPLLDYLVEAYAWEDDFVNSFYRYALLGNTALSTHVFAHGISELGNSTNAADAAPFAVSAMFTDLCPLSGL